MSLLDELRDYDYWLKYSPEFILTAVKSVGGWHRVFPQRDGQDFPVWASRVRNYFNVFPKRLKLLDNFAASIKSTRVTMGGGLAGFFARSRDIYEDDTGRLWFLFSKGGSIYHYKGNEMPDWMRATGSTFRPRIFTPVFKLTSPDGTGGSAEIVIHNWAKADLLFTELRSPTIRGMSKGGPSKSIKNHYVNIPEYRGSYNYTETFVGGYSGHNYRDIKPDRVSKDPFHIIFAPKVPLRQRRFPARYRGELVKESQ